MDKPMWTPENRLKLIKALAAMEYKNNKPFAETTKDLMQRIMFLCDMPDEFLEINKGNYEDAIKFAQADLTISL